MEEEEAPRRHPDGGIAFLFTSPFFPLKRQPVFLPQAIVSQADQSPLSPGVGLR